MGSCRECLHFDTAAVSTSAQTDYCRKSGEVITDGARIADCFEGGRKSYRELLQETILFEKKRAPTSVYAEEGARPKKVHNNNTIVPQMMIKVK